MPQSRHETGREEFDPDFVTFLTYREDILNARDPSRKERLREAARSQASYLRFLRECKSDEEVNAWHYDPLRRLTPEEREAM